MGNQDPNIDIRIKTQADLAALEKTNKQLADMTARFKAMDEAEQKSLKTQRVHGDESQQMAGHLSKLTAEAKQQGATTDKVVGIKGKWLAAIKNLKHEIPGLGYVLGALKNPFVALIAVIAIFLNSLAKIKEHIEDIKRAVGDGKITTNFERIGSILAESQVSARQLVEEIERLRGRPDTLEEQGAKETAAMERKLKGEEQSDERAKAGELSGVQDPATRAAIEEKYGQRGRTRDQRRLSFKAELATAQQIRARNQLSSGMGQIPAEEAALAAAKNKHRRSMELADAQTTDTAPLEATVAELEGILNTPALQRSVGQLQLTGSYRGDAGVQEGLATARENLANARSGNRNVGILRTKADAELGAAQGRFDRFSSGLTTSAGQVRSFGDAASEAALDSSAGRAFNGPVPGPITSGPLQARFDAFLKSIERMFNDGQQKVDSISRENNRLAAELRSQSLNQR